ncbi:unnamed protein product [Fusarium venenatum]|uniref:Uncharacterized protein n=1 Tax=Fusarium venenatum TaxID=56646 RepID=A0A2L2T0E8_9HYPO|nr:uncharacterized protein FVRRES_07384 [Fusarium venenatum]CEI62948.1 unnamed protein product [Fusarium venenatum]
MVYMPPSQLLSEWFSYTSEMQKRQEPAPRAWVCVMHWWLTLLKTKEATHQVITLKENTTQLPVPRFHLRDFFIVKKPSVQFALVQFAKRKPRQSLAIVGGDVRARLLKASLREG